MPRRPRMCIPGLPCHVITRGNDRQACFFRLVDYQFYLACLKDAIDRYQAEVHAFVLMTNHVHLLITPHQEDSIAKVMQSLGRRYVQYINHHYRRTGTLWEGRYKSSLVVDDSYVLACYRYIELNPVRAKMVLLPQEYQWSSYHFNACAKQDNLVTMHPSYVALGANNKDRQVNYRKLFSGDLDRNVESEIRTAGIFSLPLAISKHDRVKKIKEIKQHD